MSETTSKYLIAKAKVPISMDLKGFSDRLTESLPGFVFEPELTGRFEEVPAYVAQQQEMEFVLMGVPEGQIGDKYVLRFQCRTDQSLEALVDRDISGIARQLIGTKQGNEHGFMDCSKELARLLEKSGIPVCKPD